MAFQLFELPVSLISRAETLRKIPFDQPFVDSIFDGHQNGRWFVDNPDQPTAAILVRSGDIYLLGTPNDALKQFMLDAPLEAEFFGWVYGFVATSPAWDAAMRINPAYMHIGRLAYTLPAGCVVPTWDDLTARLPEGDRMIEIDAALAERIDNEDFVPLIRWGWETYSRFAEHGYGVAILRGETILAYATTMTRSDTQTAISIDTVEPYRRQGYATLVGLGYMAAGARRGLETLWDTDTVNIASQRTAERIGFECTGDYIQYRKQNDEPLTLSEGRWGVAETRPDGVMVWAAT